MGENKKEIVLMADAKVDPKSWGKTLSLYGQGRGDLRPEWYGTTEKKVNNQEQWQLLCDLKRGDRLDITWVLRHWEKDGKSGDARDLLGAEKVIRVEDDVHSSPAPAQGVAPERQPAQSRDDLIAKESAYKSAAEFMKAVGPGAVAEWVGIMSEGPAGLDEYLKAYTIIAHALYADMQGDWSCGK